MKHTDQHIIIADTEAYVKQVLGGDASGHDWWHIHRVRNAALTLGKEEGADLFVVELAALLHDIADHKFHDGDHTIGPKVTREWLTDQGLPDEIVEHIVSIVENVSYKGAGVETPMTTIEGKVVQDADRLDAIGAVGVARAFAFGGNRNRSMYEPDEAPEMHENFEDYKKSEGHTINHFYEKLLLLKDRMNTDAGRALAEKRHLFMETYLQQFYEEWDGRC